MAIRALTVDDGDVYRSIRLRALAADPLAFSSTYDREAEFGDSVWRSRLVGYQDRPGQVFVDRFEDANCGVVGIGLAQDPTDAVLWGMWVDPATRGAGIGGRLLDAAVEWALQQQTATVTLWVMGANEAARRLYVRSGFEVRADADDIAPEGCVDGVRMQFSFGL